MITLVIICLTVMTIFVLLCIAIDKIEDRDTRMYTFKEGVQVLYKDLCNKIKKKD